MLTLTLPPPQNDVKMRCYSDTSSHRSEGGEGGEALRTYLTDLVRPYGFRLRDDLGPGLAYGELGGRLLAGLRPADLLVLAFAVPDRAPWGSAASRLSSQCPGAPPAFAVCDQGTLAGFTALRLIGASLDAGQRAVLVVAEQPPGYELPAGTPAPGRAAVVALPFEQTGADEQTGPVEQPGAGGEGGAGSAVRVTVHADVAAERVPALVAAAVRELGDATLVAGNGLTADAGHAWSPDTPWGVHGLHVRPRGRAGAARLVSAPDGQPLTGVWWAAAELLGSGPLLLADYDPLLGGLALCAIAA